MRFAATAAALIAATVAVSAAPGRTTAPPLQGSFPDRHNTRARRPCYGDMRTATVTAYCGACSGNVGCRDNRLHVGDCAADPRWHKDGEKVWIQGFGVLTVRDTGGDIKGRDRFDVYLGACGQCRCGERVGRKRLLTQRR